MIEFYYELLMILAYGLIKLSIVFFYRRLFLVLKWSAFDVISLAYIAMITIWTLTCFFSILFFCKTKIHLVWESLFDTQDQCGDVFALELGLGISDLVTDIMILILPMPIVCLSSITLNCVHGQRKQSPARNLASNFVY